MNNKKSARLGFVAAIWLVLSVAVFGTLIGIAWMSMNATADVSADAISVDSEVELAISDSIELIVDTGRGYAYVPSTDTALNAVSGDGSGIFSAPAKDLGFKQNPVERLCMIDS
ncbi:MAG: hypothetical protein ACW97G_15660 [Candidatus Thorarchaeota archaeon]|jgi:hypothetical protein